MRTFTLSAALLVASQLFAQGPAARQETKLDQVYAQYGLTGQDVLTVIIDRGIDYTHPDFIDENGETRIACIFDLVDDSGASDPDNPYGAGTIYNREEINAALSGGAAISTDRYGHGTATAGIVSGDGSGVASDEFQGVAPEATIIAIKITHDFFPPFADQPGQNGAFDPNDIPIALEFAHDKIVELDMPSVTLLNIGSTGGPTDGTSAICQAIDAFSAFGHPFVCGVGDDGGGDNHATGFLSMNASQEITIEKAAGFLRFDLWYSESDRFSVSIERPGGQVSGPFAGPVSADGADDRNLGDIFIFHRGANTEFWGSTADRRELLIDFSGAAGTYKVIIHGDEVNGIGEWRATLNPATLFSNNAFTTFVEPGYSISDYPSAESCITPTDYVSDNSWTDIDGNFREIIGQGEPGEIWAGASSGPTHDGRNGVDFGSPGEVCFAAYSPNTYYSNFRFNMIQGSQGLYGIQNAVSGAAPVATGVIALMLEINPNLTPQEIKELLQMSAVQDSETGPTPNPQWGYGKLDALQAIQNTMKTVGVRDLAADQSLIEVTPNPFKDHFTVVLRDPTLEVSGAQLFSPTGQMIYAAVWTHSEMKIQPGELPSGVYWLALTSERGTFVKKLVRQ